MREFTTLSKGDGNGGKDQNNMNFQTSNFLGFRLFSIRVIIGMDFQSSNFLDFQFPDIMFFGIILQDNESVGAN